MIRSVVVLLLVATAVADDASDVIELDADSFDEGIADEDMILVEFYAPW